MMKNQAAATIRGLISTSFKSITQDEYNELRFEFGIELDDVLLWVQTRLPLNGTSLNTRKLDEETENLSYETRPKSYFVWNDPCTINVPLVFVCKY
ncbi:uncharacterized protein LOC110869128 isoform X3 [Helianthus annuus]|uniref:uncharacterized protein LOC110869128 isoform X3 n=1 Tax=Helianthus annuus TaxID=4232 RepID=UPI000B8F2162|nr:uncharacterized protein LOC110869128 isoform X3 [Helianthus annuus]